MRAEPAAVLWDFDGTLIDTEPLWSGTQQDIMAERGLAFTPEQLEAMHGQSAWLGAEMIAAHFGEPGRVREIYDDIHARIAGHIRANDLPWLPGAQRLLAELDANEVPCAIVTASNQQIIDAAVERLPGNVRFIVTSDDVLHTKPHPEPYLTAAARLGIDPSDAIVLEDSVPGTSSGLAAGAVVYAVPTLAHLQPQPRMTISSTGLRETTWAELCEVWREHESVRREDRPAAGGGAGDAHR